ncbi:MAG: methyltransferase [Beijerinckiaceae bacterium]|nr:methyltransferase [Beijerinckiaceae bacterium]
MDITEDRLLAGRLRLMQPARGHRAGTDGVLLAAVAPPDARRIADLGASTGLVGLAAALALPEARVTLFEREPDLVELSRRNIEANGLSDRAEAVECDILARGTLTDFREAFDLVLTNPPYLEAHRMRLSPTKAGAHALRAGEGETLEAWVRRAASILAPRGKLVMIHRADQVQAVLAAMQGRFGGIRLRFLHPRAGEDAIRVLAMGVKGSRGPLAIGAPLVLHEEDGRFTANMRDIHEGQGRITFSP